MANKNPKLKDTTDEELIKDLENALKDQEICNDLIRRNQLIYFRSVGNAVIALSTIKRLNKIKIMISVIETELEARGIHACRMGVFDGEETKPS